MEIQVEGLQWDEPVDGYHYKIPALKDKPEGEVQLIFKRVSDMLPEVQEVLSAHGLKPEDRIAHLNEFYPNGKGLDEKTGEHMKRGVGTEVLNFLTEQCIAQGARAIYVFSVKPSMRSFLLKKGFETFGSKNWHHILILKQS